MKKTGVVLALALATLFSAPTCAQSESMTHASALSLAPVVELSGLTRKTLKGVGRLTVVSIKTSAGISEVVLKAAGESGRLIVKTGVKTLKASGLVVGGSISVVAVSAGALLYAGSEAIAFLVDEDCLDHFSHESW